MVRLRGDLMLYLSLVSAADDGFAGAFGIGLCTNDAFAIGVTAVPTPIAQEDWDGWLFHQYYAVKGPTVGTTTANNIGGVFSTSAAFRVAVDSKAMRKIPENTTVYAAMENVEVGTAALEVAFNSRVLVKLP